MKTKVKKASSLKSLDELVLSDKAKTYFGDDDLEEVVIYGRRIAYAFFANPKRAIKNNSKCGIELMHALDEAGFIRDDIDPLSIDINTLYCMVYGSNIFTQNVDEINNELYEEYENYTDKQVGKVLKAIRRTMPEEWAEILILHYGLEGETKTAKDIGEMFDMTGENARQIIYKAIKSLRDTSALPPIIVPPESIKKETEEIRKQLESLNCLSTSEIRRQRKRLKEIVKYPYAGVYEIASKLLKDTDSVEGTSIDELNLTARTHNYLIRSGIKTIEQLKAMPLSKLMSIKSPSSKRYIEICEKLSKHNSP